METIKKCLYILLGVLAIGLGIIGAILPIVPTTPFLLVALLCFSKGSKRWNDWFTGTKLYKKYVRQYVKRKGITFNQKVYILLVADVMILIPLILVDILIVRLSLIILILIKYYYFIYKIETIKINTNEGNDDTPEEGD